MATKISISIPEPCHENWQAMTVVEKGRFCDSCQKKVFDFTSASDRQIIESFSKNNHLCGRFTTSQLNRELIQPKEKNTIWLAASATIISLLGLGSQEISAQEKANTVQTISEELVGKIIPVKDKQDEREITGNVSDATSPLPSANVQIKGTTRAVQTDFDGNFSIKAKENEVLVISFIGMEEKELIIDKSNNYNIVLKESVVGNSEVIVTVGIIRKKRTFFGRIFYRIGNWFR